MNQSDDVMIIKMNQSDDVISLEGGEYLGGDLRSVEEVVIVHRVHVQPGDPVSHWSDRRLVTSSRTVLQ